MVKIELLLPAGNWDCLEAAVENGADAVFLGVDRFNARKRASNFKLNEIKKITDYCHQNGVKVFCTLNILIKNSEINDFFSTIKKLYQNNIDAVIIQEISFLPIIKKNFPGLEVHLSTQSAISNSHFQELIKEADRVILPREFSEDEIINFKRKTHLPIEIFVQGALCFSYSGKCLFSSVIGGRSGNRGSCAQPCRRRYNQKYLLSMKDLCLIEEIPAIIKAGVCSLKIEGRLRSPKYVAAAAKLYRKAIDSYYAGNFSIDDELFKEMKLAFNREFTKGYYAQEKEIISSDRPMGRGLHLGVINKDDFIVLKEEIKIGDGVGIWLKGRVDGAVIKKLTKNNQSIDSAHPGDKVKLFIHAPAGTDIYLTSSKKPPKKIEFKQNQPILMKRNQVVLKLPEIKNNANIPRFLVKVYKKKAGLSILDEAVVFYNIFSEDFDSRFGAYIPRILSDDDVIRAFNLVEKHQVKNILIGDLGFFSYIQKKDFKCNIYLDYSANVFNDYDLDFFLEAVPIISPELSFNEIKKFKNKNFSVMVHGKIVVMNTKYLSLPDWMEDEKNYHFPVRKEHNYLQILNSKELGLFNDIKKLDKAGIKSYFFDLEQDVKQTLITYKKILLNQKVKINTKKYTKSHFEKGVL